MTGLSVLQSAGRRGLQAWAFLTEGLETQGRTACVPFAPFPPYPSVGVSIPGSTVVNIAVRAPVSTPVNTL